jgi:hypothetical protein
MSADPSRDPGHDPTRLPVLFIAALAAAAGPSLLAHNVSPSPTFWNQALALGLWGGFVMLLAAGPQRAGGWAASRAAAPVQLALLLFAAAALWSGTRGSLPSALCLSALGLLGATALLVHSGAAARGSAEANTLVRAVLRRLAGGRRAEPGHRAGAGLRARLARRRVDCRQRHRRPCGRQPAPAQPPEQPAAVVGDRRRGAAAAAPRAARAGHRGLRGDDLRRGADGVTHRAGQRGRAGAVGPAGPPPVAAGPGAAAVGAGALCAGLVRHGALGRIQPAHLRRRSKAGRDRCVGLAFRHLGQHAVADPGPAVDRRGLWRIQPRVVADALPGPADGLLRPHAQPAAATGGGTGLAAGRPDPAAAAVGPGAHGAAGLACRRRRRRHAPHGADVRADDQPAQPAGVPAVVRLLPAASGLGLRFRDGLATGCGSRCAGACRCWHLPAPR